MKIVSISPYSNIDMLDSIARDLIFFRRSGIERYNDSLNFFFEGGVITNEIWSFLLGPRVSRVAPVYIAMLKNCLILPSGLIITREGDLIAESLYPETPEAFLDRGGLSTDEKNMRLAFLNDQFDAEFFLKLPRAVHCREQGEAGYFHWIASILPRLMLILENFDGNIGSILIEAPDGFQASWLKLISPKAPLIRHAGRGAIVESLIFPSSSQLGDSHYTRNPWLIQNFRSNIDSLLKGHARGSRLERIYISREDAPVRRLRNEHLLLEQLKNIGFRSVLLSNMSVIEQINIFLNASIVVGPHGAGLANIMFSNKNTKVVEIMSCQRTWPGFRVIAKACDIDYRSYISTKFNQEQTPINGLGNEDFDVDIESCVRFIKMAAGDMT